MVEKYNNNDETSFPETSDIPNSSLQDEELIRVLTALVTEGFWFRDFHRN
jgi:hypothetical protein